MKTIRIVLMLVGFYVSHVYGASPEFYGIYASNNNKLIEMGKNKPANDFGQNVQFLVFQKQAEMYANSLTIMRAIFVRTVDDPGLGRDQPPKNVNTWKPSNGGAVETRTKPVAGKPEQIYVVPRSPLSAGMYIVSIDDGGMMPSEIGRFFVNKDLVERGLAQGENCIDIVVGGGWASQEYALSGTGGKAIPCSNSSPATSGSNAAPITATDTGAMVRVPGKNYEMGKYEVTQKEWREVMGSNPSKFSNCGDTCPVEQVSWDDIQTFIQKLNAKTSKQYRLPTEAEWEYACYGGSQTEYCGGNDLDAVAWARGNSNEQTHPAGQKQANGYGLYDMSGNVAEWMNDCWEGDCAKRGVRGGAWGYRPQVARAANRIEGVVPANRYDSVGFRLARTLTNATPSTATGAGTSTGASGKVSDTQKVDVDKELLAYLDRPTVSADEEKEFGRKEADRVNKLQLSPEHLRLIKSRRDVVSRNENDFPNIINLSLQILQIDPADFMSIDYLANFYTKVNEPDKALMYASKSLKSMVRGRTFAMITYAYLAKKDKKNTLLWLEKTLQSQYPYHPSEKDMIQAFPEEQVRITQMFKQYAQPLPNVAEGVASVFKSIFGGIKSALPKQDAAADSSKYSQAVAETHQAPASAVPASVPPEKVAVTGWESVVPGGRLGEFGNGTKVSKTKKGELVLASNKNPMTHTHPGIDIVAECGSPIYPLADGEVFDVINSKDDGDWGEEGKKGLGYMAIIKHDVPINNQQTYSLYLHMQEEPSVKPGDKVMAGKTILGKIGKTGAAWGCHTHFEVRHFGTRYLTDKGWNYPANIYGKGEQAQRLTKYWEDPIAITTR